MINKSVEERKKGEANSRLIDLLMALHTHCFTATLRRKIIKFKQMK